jgi:YaiO family outer membrane protein
VVPPPPPAAAASAPGATAAPDAVAVTEKPVEKPVSPEPVKAFSAAAANDNDDFRVEAQGFFADYSEPYGSWFGTHARAWLLDVTGLRGISGYFDMVDLHWRPGGDGKPVESTLMLGRVLKNWSEHFYTFLTAGGTAGEAVFPRLKIEGELDFIIPHHEGTVLAFGGGQHGYDGSNRPYVLAGASYALARAAFIYRIWFGRGVSRDTATTHLLTWFWGERLRYWARFDLLWGESSQVTGALLPDRHSQIDSRAVSFTYEKWLSRHFGANGRLEVSHAYILNEKGRRVRGVQTELGAFVTF